MRLLSLELRNYRKFRQAALEFPQGLIGVLGPNGVGKSTLVEAIAWALYGNKPEIVRTTKEGLKRVGARPADPCEAILRFLLDRDEFRVVRRLEGRALAPKVFLEINGKLAAQGDEAVAEALLKRLGLDHKAFFTSVFARQKELGALSELDPAERKRLILRMLQVETVEEGLRRLSADQTALTQSVAVGRVRLESMVTVEQRLDELARQVGEIQGTLAGLHERVRSSQVELERLEAVRRELEGKRRRASEFDQELAAGQAAARAEERRLGELQEELQQLQKAARELDALPQVQKELEAAEERLKRLLTLQETAALQRERAERIESLEQTHKRSEKERERLRRELDKEADLPAEIADANGKLAETRSEWDELQRGLAELVQRQAVARGELAHSEEHLAQFQRLGPESPCPTCGRPLSEVFGPLTRKTEETRERSRQTLHEIQTATERLEVTRGELERRLAALEKKRQALSKREIRRAELQTSFSAQAAELKRSKAEFTKLLAKAPKAVAAPSPAELEQAQRTVEGIRKRYTALVATQTRVAGQLAVEASITSLERSLGEWRRRGEQLKASLESLGRPGEELEKTRSELEAATRAFAEVRRDEGGATARLQQLSEERGRIEVELERLTKAAEELSSQERELLSLAQLGELLRAFKESLIGRIVPALSAGASELLAALTGGRYRRLHLDEDYTAELESEGGRYPLPRFSGGETDLANLCLRLAISQALASQGSAVALRFVVLDEIFGSQDQERRRNLLLALAALEREQRFDQIFVITHLEEIKDALPQAILVREDEEGISTAEFAAI